MNSTFHGIKIPVGLELRSRILRNYAGFALLKMRNQEGRIYLRDLYTDKKERKNYANLVKRLYSLGWIEKNDNYILLKSYQHVWNTLGVERFQFKDKSDPNRTYHKYYYKKVDASKLPRSRRKCVDKIISLLEEEVCDRKARQIRYRLNQDKAAKRGDCKTHRQPVPLSSALVAKMLGYKSPNFWQCCKKEMF